MRAVLYAAATLAVAATLSPTIVGGVLAAAAGALCEATPFLLAGAILEAIVCDDRFVAYAGCGCGRGPSARSIPAAVATALIFGVWVALARFVAAIIVARFTLRRLRHNGCALQPATVLDGLRALCGAAMLAGCASQVAAYVDVRTLPLPAQLLAGVVLGFVAAPCALGSVAIAAALHARAPVSAAAFLCIAGIVDLRASIGRREMRAHADATAYIVLAISLAVVAARHGDGLVRPAFALPLALCATCAILSAMRYRRRRNPALRFAPALMLAGALVTAPPPAYTATETTATDLFAGERLVFTGRLARNRTSAALVRYAITCCRADAAPVVVRLRAVPSFPMGTWVRATGTVENVAGDFRLRAGRLETIASPSDPFIYF